MFLTISVLVFIALTSVSYHHDSDVQFECTAHNYKEFPDFRGDWLILREITTLTFFKNSLRAVVKGKAYIKGEGHYLDRVATYNMHREQQGTYRLTLVKMNKLSRDSLMDDDDVTPYILGLSPGESRTFRFRWLNDSTLLIGSQTQYQTACTHYPI